MNTDSTNIFYTLKKINKIVKTMEGVSLKKSQMQGAPSGQLGQHSEAIQAAHELFKVAPVPNQTNANALGYRELAKKISDSLGLSAGVQSYAQISMPNSSFFNSIQQSASQILADNGILNGDKSAMNKKPIAQRPRIFVVGPSASLDHGNGYLYMHAMLNRAMKLLGITHDQEPIFMFSQPHPAKSNYIYLQNIANGISPSYERDEDSSTSLDASGLTRAFARTFGHDTFELPTTEVSRDSQQSFQQFMDTIGLRLATHAIVLGQPDLTQRSAPQYDRRVHVQRQAEAMGLPVLTTNSGYEAPRGGVTGTRAQDLRTKLGITSDDAIYDGHADAARRLLVDVAPNLSSGPLARQFSCTITAPEQWVPPVDQHLGIDQTVLPSKRRHYAWSYNDQSNSTVKAQRTAALVDDQHWVRLLSASPYKTMSGSFLLGDSGNGGPLLGPNDFAAPSGKHVPAFMTLIPTGSTAITPYLFHGSHASLHGTSLMSQVASSAPHLQDTIDDIANAAGGGIQNHQVPRKTSALVLPAAVTKQFLEPRLPAADQAFAVLSTHLKRHIATKPIHNFQSTTIPAAVQGAIQSTKNTVDS